MTRQALEPTESSMPQALFGCAGCVGAGANPFAVFPAVFLRWWDGVSPCDKRQPLDVLLQNGLGGPGWYCGSCRTKMNADGGVQLSVFIRECEEVRL